MRIGRNPHKSMRKMAKELGVDREMVRRVVRKDLNMTHYKLKKAEFLSPTTQEKRLQKSRLLRSNVSGGWENLKLDFF